MTRSLTMLRMIGWAEGLSFLLLLGVAMPLKHLAGKPLAVRIVGMLHGVLFMAYVGTLLHVHLRARWPLGRTALFLGASLLPFGPFLMDRRLREGSPSEGGGEA